MNNPRKSKWWAYGFEEGVKAAKVNIDISSKEMMKAVEEDSVGEIAGEVRESESQYAGDIVYEVGRKGGPTEDQFEKWEEGFYDGFHEAVKKWAMKMKKKPRMLFNRRRR